MKHSRFTRGLAMLLTALFLLSFSAAAIDEPPGGFGGGGFGGDGGNAPSAPSGGGSGSQSFYTGDAVTDLTSGTYTGKTFTDSTNAGEVAVRVGPGVTASITDSSVTKSAGDMSGDDSSFYGVNSGILAYSTSASSPANLTLDNVKVTTSSQGANGVFAYGDATIHISNSTVTTNGAGGAGGIMVAGGGSLYAENCTVTTAGGSSAAIRSDRGSGTMVVNGGSYIATGEQGTGSPAIYCVADITVSNATLSAGNAQAICFEGRNPAKLYNCYLEGNYTASDDDENSNVMIYQSMSGDSTEGTTYCTMVGGVLKANNTSENGNAKMFYTTNTYCYISLCDVQMVYSDTMDTFLLCACNTNSRGWGTAGANGSECVLYAVDQDMSGNMIYDTWSYLGIFMRDGSTLNGAIQCREDNGDRGCDLYMDADSVWTVTGNSTVRDFHNASGTILDSTGKTVTICSSSGTVYQKGTGAYTITVTGTYDTADLTAEENVPGIGTVADGAYSFDTDTSAYFDSDYIPTAPDGTVYADTLGHRESAEHTHTYGNGVVTTPATCVTEGVMTYTCTSCGAVKTEAIAATGVHTWDNGTLTTPMTDDQDGVVTYTCRICGQTKTTLLPAGGSPFVDVQDSSQYYSTPVLWAVSQNITAGTSSFEFSPTSSCTRAQVVTFLWRAAGKPEVSGSNPFSDVKESDYFYKAVLWAVANGITAGTSETTFSPDTECTRGQAVTFLYRAAEKPSVSGTSNPFTDVKTGNYFYGAVLWAVDNGITKGTSAATFSPNDTCTRAQVVTFLYRYMGK